MSRWEHIHEFLGMVFYENVLHLSRHGLYVVSYRKAVYNMSMLLLSLTTIYLVSLHLFPQRQHNFVQGFSLWTLVCMQLLPPAVSLITNLLTSTQMANCSNTTLGIYRTVRTLGYKGRNDNTSFDVMFTVACTFLCIYLVIDVFMVLSYVHVPIFFSFLRNHIIFFVCITFDAGNQIYRARHLLLLKNYTVFINSLLSKENFLKVTGDLQQYKLNHAKKVFSSIAKLSVRLNSKFSPYLIAHCSKMVISAAPYFSDYFIEVFLPEYFSVYDYQGISRSNIITTIRLLYDLVYLVWVIRVHLTVEEEVSGWIECGNYKNTFIFVEQ